MAKKPRLITLDPLHQEPNGERLGYVWFTGPDTSQTTQRMFFNGRSLVKARGWEEASLADQKAAREEIRRAGWLPTESEEHSPVG